MPSYAECISCKRRCRVGRGTAKGGPKCRKCRQLWCLGCGQPYKRRHNSAFCSDECARRFLRVLAAVAA